MLKRLFGYEFFVEIVPKTKKFVDWDISNNDNHIWFGSLHVIWNRTGEDHGRGCETEPIDEVP